MPQLTQEERCQIFGLKESGFSMRAIAKKLTRSHTTIIRELARNKVDAVYQPNQAHRCCLERKKRAAALPLAAKNASRALAIEWMKRCKASPEQISGRLELEGHEPLSHESIYKMVWDDKRKGGELYKLLRRQGKCYKKRGQATSGRGLIPNRVDIEERPKVVEEKSRVGDWEGDTVIGAKHEGVLLTLVDRYSKYVIIQELISKHAEPVTHSIIQRLGELDLPVRTITFDNGREFAGHERIATSLNAACYFARAYHSWERGLNEHTNGLIRQYFPKKSSLAGLTAEEVQQVQDELNHRPRKCLGYRTPHEVLHEAILRQAA